MTPKDRTPDRTILLSYSETSGEIMARWPNGRVEFLSVWTAINLVLWCVRQGIEIQLDE